MILQGIFCASSLGSKRIVDGLEGAVLTTAQRKELQKRLTERPYADCVFNFSMCFTSSSSLAKPQK